MASNPTPLDLAELRRLEKAATSGPWTASNCAIDGPFTPKGRVGSGFIANAMKRRPEDPLAQHDAVFIAAARNALPALLDLVDAQRKEIEVANAALRKLATCLNDVYLTQYLAGDDEASKRIVEVLEAERRRRHND